MKHLTWVLLLCLPTLLMAQNIQGTWEIDIKEQQDSVLYLENEQTIEFLDSVFTIQHSTKDLAHQGNFSTEGSELILKPELSSLNDIVFDFQFSSDSVLSLTSEKFKLQLNKLNTTESISEIAASKVIISNQNFSFNSLWRGVLGMFSLLLIAYILSKNKKAINWKTVGFGLLAQLILAIGVLKIPFVQSAFEFVGNIFVKILDFTAAGSEFLLGDLMDTSTYGYIFKVI